MRLGQEQEARQQLEQCYDAGYKNAETVNSLRLDGQLQELHALTKPATPFSSSRRKKPICCVLTSKPRCSAPSPPTKKNIRLKLKGPVQLEVYPDHEDFAVRTMGMPGLGALGVTFGSVVAMDSPSGRPPGTFHWASTMWHELSHVFVLQATNHRVPRWFTEGMAVYEETAAAPGLGRSPGSGSHQRHPAKACCRWPSSTAALFAPAIRRK